MMNINKNIQEAPNIYDYLNYRVFLRELYDFKKLTGNYSYRTFSRLAGFRSSNFIKLIMDGERNLSTVGIHKFAKGFKLNKSSTQFFECLVHFNQAKTVDEKNHYYARILQSKNHLEAKPLEVSQYRYFSNWYYVALRELVGLKSFREDPNWINRMLGSKLSYEDIHEAVTVLLELGLVFRNEQKCLKLTEAKIATSSDIESLAVFNFHQEMIAKAKEALEKTPSSLRDISALTVSVTKDQFDQIKDRVNQFRREIHEIANQGKDKQAVYQLNLQLFNLSEVPWAGED
jgi:uncharacterized protein (TIGR02147 family)